MATYVYVVKEVRSSGEANDPVPDYDGAAFVAAMRDGTAFSTELYDLRGNLLTLANYAKKYCPAFDRDGKLYLYNSDLNTSYALLLFGSYNRLLQSKSRMLVDLANDATWMKLDEIYCGGRGWTAKFLEKKFGTDHKKLFLMIAPNTFSNMIQGGKETDCYSTSQTMVRRTDLERWIHTMSYPGGY